MAQRAVDAAENGDFSVVIFSRICLCVDGMRDCGVLKLTLIYSVETL